MEVVEFPQNHQNPHLLPLIICLFERSIQGKRFPVLSILFLRHLQEVLEQSLRVKFGRFMCFVWFEVIPSKSLHSLINCVEINRCWCQIIAFRDSSEVLFLSFFIVSIIFVTHNLPRNFVFIFLISSFSAIWFVFFFKKGGGVGYYSIWIFPPHDRRPCVCVWIYVGTIIMNHSW